MQRRTSGGMSPLRNPRHCCLALRIDQVAHTWGRQANKVVAIDLEISERTVEIHRSQVMQKMAARNLADLVKMKILLDQNSD